MKLIDESGEVVTVDEAIARCDGSNRNSEVERIMGIFPNVPRLKR